MKILEIESRKGQLLERLGNSYSKRAKVFFIYSFIDELLSTNNTGLIAAYLPEFIYRYLDYLENYNPYGFHPKNTEKIINQLANLKRQGSLTEYEEKISKVISKLEMSFFNLTKILEGKNSNVIFQEKAFFPLIEEDSPNQTDMTFGVIESLTIKISKAKFKDEFIIIPSEKELEKNIADQVNRSLSVALWIIKNYVKSIHQFHEVIISFDSKPGICFGNSLGSALTLALIEELLSFYNSQKIISIGAKTAFTGGVDESGLTINTSENVIKLKTELIFFSGIKQFVVPKSEEVAALSKLSELQKEFPNRDLKIIGIEDVTDLLNRRNLVDITKQKIIVRSSKIVRKHWLSFSLMVLLLLSVYFAGYWDFDTSPYKAEIRDQLIQVKNKNGKLLWTKQTIVSNYDAENLPITHQITRIEDVNGDDVPEVFVCMESSPEANNLDVLGKISCYNYKGDFLWQFTFLDTISTPKDLHTSSYRLWILDIYKENGQKYILVGASNLPLYPGAIFRLNAVTGERIPGTLWNAGHINAGFVDDIDNDGKLDAVVTASNNAFQCAIVFSFDLNNLAGQTPSKTDYTFIGIDIAKLNACTLIPKSDISLLMKRSINSPMPGYLVYNHKSGDITFPVYEGADTIYSYQLHYRMTSELKVLGVSPGDAMQIRRDSLVVSGKLSYPITNTAAYTNKLLNQVLYWDGQKFVKK